MRSAVVNGLLAPEASHVTVVNVSVGEGTVAELGRSTDRKVLRGEEQGALEERIDRMDLGGRAFYPAIIDSHPDGVSLADTTDLPP
jgi:predicted amidohydrolase YtcJ